EAAYAADMRYVGQAYELEVPIRPPLAREDLAGVTAAFHAVHERVYGYHRVEQAVEFINFRAVHRHALPPPRLRSPERDGLSLADARGRERPVHFAPAGFVPTPVYERARLADRVRIPGPAIVEQPDTTTVIPPGWAALVEAAGSLRIRKG
ncbi:MAG: hydantoinase/oxoprolinase family protein, partial [Candidatus Rokuibacteriota bacterium]